MKDIGYSSPILNIDFFIDALGKAAEIPTIGYTAKENIERCGWMSRDPPYIAYHDNEWGVPGTDSKRLFEVIYLEGQQVGLPWITALKKRENYRACFHQLDSVKVAAAQGEGVEGLVQNAGIVRHQGEVQAVIGNVQVYLQTGQNGEPFVDFAWSFVNHQPQVTQATTLNEVSTFTSTSDTLSKALRRRDFRFVSTTICYSFMRACGLVNDHVVGCCCYPENKP